MTPLTSYCQDGMRWFGPEGSNDPREWDSTECHGCEECLDPDLEPSAEDWRAYESWAP